jgi:hypothetical protein
MIRNAVQHSENVRNSLVLNYKSDCDWLFLRKRHAESALKSQAASRPLGGGRVRGWRGRSLKRVLALRKFSGLGPPKLEIAIASKNFLMKRAERWRTCSEQVNFMDSF